MMIAVGSAKPRGGYTRSKSGRANRPTKVKMSLEECAERNNLRKRENACYVLSTCIGEFSTTLSAGSFLCIPW